MRITKINLFLNKRGTSQKEIADHFGLHKSTVSLLFSGDLILDHRLAQFASYLGISRRKLDGLIKEERRNGGANGKH